MIALCEDHIDGSGGNGMSNCTQHLPRNFIRHALGPHSTRIEHRDLDNRW